MVRNTRAQMIAVLAVGGLLGYVAASSRLDIFHSAKARAVALDFLHELTMSRGVSWLNLEKE